MASQNEIDDYSEVHNKVSKIVYYHPMFRPFFVKYSFNFAQFSNLSCSQAHRVPRVISASSLMQINYVLFEQGSQSAEINLLQGRSEGGSWGARDPPLGDFLSF